MVDDSNDTTEMLKVALRLDGATVATANSAVEALATLSQQPFDVILSDIAMPGMDGFEFLHQLRNLPLHTQTPVLALTGFACPEDVDRAHREGFLNHVPKPIDFVYLRTTLQSLMQRNGEVAES